MSDGLVIWETPTTRKTLHLRTTATAILGVKEDDIALSKLYVGDKLGQLHIVQLPEFTLVSTSTISHAPLRSMCMNDQSQLLIADAEGRSCCRYRWESFTLFETNAVSSIRTERGTFAFNQVGSNVSTTMMEPSQIGKMLPPRLETILCFEGCGEKAIEAQRVKLRLNSDCCHLPDWFPVPIEAKREPVHARVMYAQVWAMNVAIHLGLR